MGGRGVGTGAWGWVRGSGRVEGWKNGGGGNGGRSSTCVTVGGWRCKRRVRHAKAADRARACRLQVHAVWKGVCVWLCKQATV